MEAAARLDDDGRDCPVCETDLRLEIENGSDPWPATGGEFTGYAEHWDCPACGWGEIVQVLQ